MKEFLGKTIAEMVAIASPSGREEKMTEYVIARLKKDGLKAKRDADGNVWAEVGAGKRRLHANAHMDTVVAGDGWKGDPLKARITGGRVYGLGSSDCKAGIAALLWLAPRVKTRIRVVYSFTVCEEGVDLPKPNGSEKMAAMGGDWAVLCEPTCEAGVPLLGIGTQGHARADVRFRGEAAHSSRPEDGRNAIYAAARFCSELERLNGRFEEFEVAPGAAARATVAATIIRGGTLSNVIPDAAEVTVSRRLAPGETRKTFRMELDSLLEGADADYTVASDGDGALTRRDGDLLRAAKAASGRAGGKGRLAFARGRTDAIIFARHDMDTLTVGPGVMGQCHVANEYVDLAGAVAAVRLLEELIGNLA